MKYAFMVSMESLLLLEKSSRSLAFNSAWVDMSSSSFLGGGGGGDRSGLGLQQAGIGYSRAGTKFSSSSLVISMLGSGLGALVCSRMKAMVREIGSSAAGNSHCGRIFEFLQALCILWSLVSPVGISIPCG